ncbi:MAG: shikimate dehydrogenase [Bacteroidetes bacterium]|nr:shikimate dehydrogenase [Bacteroidota bacterium]
MHYGIIGFPLSHSFSEKYFTNKFQTEGILGCDFKLFPIKEISELPELLKTNILSGFSVTIPYKEKILNFLDDIDETAQKIGAVNCVKVDYDAVNKPFLIGYNTDIFGFSMSIKPFLASQHERALILGTGGASKAVKYVLDELGIQSTFVSRLPQISNCASYEMLNKNAIKNNLLIINTTPVGMFPHTFEKPNIPYEFLTKQHLLFDLIYNPVETEFLKEGKKYGTLVENGMNMLALQAEKAWEIWNAQ